MTFISGARNAKKCRNGVIRRKLVVESIQELNSLISVQYIVMLYVSFQRLIIADM